MNIQQQTETGSQTSSDRMMILDDHKSPIKVCISTATNDSNPELNNNSIVLIQKCSGRADHQANGRLGGNQFGRAANRGERTADDELIEQLKENLNEQPKPPKHQVKQKKFAMAAKQLNKPMTSSQSFSSVCLKNINNFDAIEMLEPSSSCSSVYSRKENSQVDQV